MTTLKEFEEALREQGLDAALAVLEKLRERDRAKRSMSPARRISGRKMTPDLAHHILELHRTTAMTQQEIAFRLGVNQGRVNEVIKRGKWLEENPQSPEAIARDRALDRARRGVSKKSELDGPRPNPNSSGRRQIAGQLTFSNFYWPDEGAVSGHSIHRKRRPDNLQNDGGLDTDKPLDLAAIRNASGLKG